MRHRHILKYALGIVLCVFIMLAVLFGLSDFGSYEKRVSGTKLSLAILRSSVDEFKKLNNKYPSTLTEMYEFAGIHPNSKIHKDQVCEYISLTGFQGNSIEHKEMDGLGGWFYSPTYGVVKVNLNMPLKCYMKMIIGKERNDIPSNW